MDKKTLQQFDNLNILVETEVKDIADRLLEEYDTYKEAVEALAENFKSEFHLEDYVYSKIHQRMIAQATNKAGRK